MKQRIITGILLALIGLPIIFRGGVAYWLLIAALLGTSAWELGRMFRASGSPADPWTLIGGSILAPLVQALRPDWLLPFFTAWMLIAISRFLLAYEKGQQNASTGFAVTVGGWLYLSLLGVYFIRLRELPNGAWWFLLVLPIIWAADSGAYFIGRAWGRHKLSPRISPKKTWEGYLGGILSGLLLSVLLAWIYGTQGKLDITPWQGALLGLALPVITPLGDLAESLFKREAGIKDSSHIFPGHGGAFDRIDSWLWAAFIGYLLILSF